MTAPPGERLAAAAAALVGCRFRLHGREPETGLDCVGLVAAALQAIGRPVDWPQGYRLRTGSDPRLARLAAAQGFAPACGTVRPGEVWVFEPGPGQVHFAIVAPGRGALVEAHAGLRRVVLTPLAPGPQSPVPAPLPPTLAARWALAT